MTKTLKRENRFKVSIPILILFVLTLFATTSCNNVVKLQQGGLSITVPGGRATTDNLSYTVSIRGLSGSSQTKTVTGGQTVTFEELAPDTYTVEVEGKEADKIVYYGTSSATVTAGSSTATTIALIEVVSDFDDLKDAVDDDGTVYVYGNISVTEGLTINTNVKLVAVSRGATIINKQTTAPLFTVSTGGNLTLSGGTSSLILDGGLVSQSVVDISSGGTLTMNDNITITKAASNGVKVKGGAFTMYGGSIQGNISGSGGGVYVQDGGNFTMSGGTITSHTILSNGGAVYVKSGTFTMEGGSIEGNTAISSGGGVYVNSGTFTMKDGSIEGNTASSGGGVYVFSDATFNMNGGTITGNKFPEGTNGQGKGVYVASPSSSTTDFSMGGSAMITSDNDVYLNTSESKPDNLFIKINSPLTNTDRVATITPLNYGNNNIEVLKAGDGVDLSKEHSKFAVTSKGTEEWTINEEGKLQQK